MRTTPLCLDPNPPLGSGIDDSFAEQSGTLEARIVELAASGVVAAAGAQAAAYHLSLGGTVTYLLGTQIVREHADGRIEVLKELPEPAVAIPQNTK